MFADLKFTLFKRVAQVAGRSEFTLANRDDDRREIHIALVLVPVLAGWPPNGPPSSRKTHWVRPAAISTSRHEQRRNGCRRVVVHGRKNMRVGLQGDRDVRVAEPFLHDTGVNSGL